MLIYIVTVITILALVMKKYKMRTREVVLLNEQILPRYTTQGTFSFETVTNKGHKNIFNFACIALYCSYFKTSDQRNS